MILENCLGEFSVCYIYHLLHAVKGVTVDTPKVLRIIYHWPVECRIGVLDRQNSHTKRVISTLKNKRNAKNKEHSPIYQIFIFGLTLAGHSLEQTQLSTSRNQTQQRLHRFLPLEADRLDAERVKSVGKCQTFTN